MKKAIATNYRRFQKGIYIKCINHSNQKVVYHISCKSSTIQIGEKFPNQKREYRKRGQAKLNQQASRAEPSKL